MNDASYDLVVVGSGIAGLFAAVKAAQSGASVALITKAALEESNTRYAQGGIAAAVFADDNAELHIADTLAAGAGLCNEEAVKVLCSEGPDRIYELLELGVQFDSVNGDFERGLEAAHSRARVLHAGGDATGARIETALANAIRHHNVNIFEHTFLVDLVANNGAVAGVHLLDNNAQAFNILGRATLLATGGAGQLFLHTTNPAVATGDGTAAAFRAGALIADAEFYQFHPTALAVGDTFLISEAVRGEGALLRNAAGEAFMTRYHPQADLAPRDVVARAIATEMQNQDGQPVVLDATAMSSEFLAKRFPTISRHLADLNIDWSTTTLPVTPAAHYFMGGIRTDTWGRTSLPGLYAVGETACTGIHGANRLASNSLLEGIVFGKRMVQHFIDPAVADAVSFTDTTVALSPPLNTDQASQPTKVDVQQLMWNNAGLMRDHDDLQVARKQIASWYVASSNTDTESYEVRNLLTIARILIEAALARTESRGAHFRTDFQGTAEQWRHSLAFTC